MPEFSEGTPPPPPPRYHFPEAGLTPVCIGRGKKKSALVRNRIWTFWSEGVCTNHYTTATPKQTLFWRGMGKECSRELIYAQQEAIFRLKKKLNKLRVVQQVSLINSS